VRGGSTVRHRGCRSYALINAKGRGKRKPARTRLREVARVKTWKGNSPSKKRSRGGRDVALRVGAETLYER